MANAQSEGFEAFLKMTPVKWLDVNFEYTFTLARDVDANVPLARRPQDSFNIRAEVRPWSDVRFGAGLTQVSNRYDISATTGAIVQLAAYTLLRFTAAYDVPLQEFAAIRAERDAENRAARELAELLRLVIAQDLERTAR